MRNDEHGAIAESRLDCRLDFRVLCTIKSSEHSMNERTHSRIVDRRRRLIKEYDSSVSHQRPRERYERTLSNREIGTSRFDHRFEMKKSALRVRFLAAVTAQTGSP